ncbi:MAG: type IV secretion system protein DotC [Alphaproteobacteria bacterium]|nr:type IV secretion system protein DotC [Alphaproteobacteria bacterium]
MIKCRKKNLFVLLALAACMLVAACSTCSAAELDPPPNKEYLQSQRYDESVTALSQEMPLDIRLEALKEAALSYGARGGLAWRTYFIRQELNQSASQMDKIYNFRQLLIRAPSGFVIEPPIVSEALDAIIIEGDGQKAAVSDTIYNINRNARFTSTARSWRQYLERDWGEVEDPPGILLPRTKEEIVLWERLVDKGWDEGIEQADVIFEEDLNRLNADFKGMIRYKKLLAQGMVSPPYALMVNRGVTGGGEEMRVGDRALEITGKPALISETGEWRPVSR